MMSRKIKLGKSFKVGKDGKVTTRDPVDIAPDASAKIAARKRKTTAQRVVRRGTVAK